MNGNPFYVQPMNDYSGVFQAATNQMADYGANRDAEERFTQTKEAMQTAWQSGDPDQIAQLAIDYPESQQTISMMLGLTDDKKKQEALSFSRQMLSTDDPQQISNMYKTRIDTLIEQGRDPTDSIGSYESWARNPQAERKNLESIYASQASKQEWDAYRGGGKGSNLGQVSPKDFTVESMASYEQSGDIADLERYRPKTVKIGNIEHAFNAESQKYEPVVDYGDAGLTEQEAAAAENEANRQARLDFGKERSKWESNQPKYLNTISAAEQKQTVVRNTADKIKDLMGGWANKYGASLSGLPGSEARTLRGLIDTMKANSAFSTLIDLKASGGTLGAISEAELNLLERAWGALDQGGDVVEFERVLDQLVDQNFGSLGRLRNAYGMNKSRYSGNYDDAQRSIEAKNTVSWDQL